MTTRHDDLRREHNRVLRELRDTASHLRSVAKDYRQTKNRLTEADCLDNCAYAILAILKP